MYQHWGFIGYCLLPLDPCKFHIIIIEQIIIIFLNRYIFHFTKLNNIFGLKDFILISYFISCFSIIEIIFVLLGLIAELGFMFIIPQMPN